MGFLISPPHAPVYSWYLLVSGVKSTITQLGAEVVKNFLYTDDGGSVMSSLAPHDGKIQIQFTGKSHFQ